MSDPGPATEAIQRQIAMELIAVHEDSYGASASNVEVAIHPSFVAVILDVELTISEKNWWEPGMLTGSA